MISVVLALSVFLLAFAGMATDYANFWHQRQKAQGAADAACQGGAMDLLLYAEGQATPAMNFDPANGGFSCASNPAAAPCIIGKFNGFDSSKAGTTINLSFPRSVPGVPLPGMGVTYPYIQVDVAQEVPAYLTRLLTRRSSVTVGGHATCGLTAPPGPVPLVVLHKNAAGALSVGGSASISIIGGPQRSIQVNSSSSTAANVGTIDLTRAGPAGTGGDFAVVGGPTTKPGSVSLGSTGHWIYPASPISDPYAQINAPSQPPTPGLRTTVPYKTNGCPDSSGCDEFTAGYYPSGILVKNNHAIFDPGLYYVVGGMNMGPNVTVRVSTAVGDGSGGVVFYFKGTGTVSVDANSGKKPATSAYYVNGSVSPQGVTSRAMLCPGSSSVVPPQLPATLNGNILLGPCSGPYADPLGQDRGFVFIQDRSAAAQPTWGGGGQFLVAGYMYFHQCNASGTGINCSKPGVGGYGTSFGMQGNACSGSYVVGSLITDSINIGGTPCINMILNPKNSFAQLKVALLK